MEQSGWSTHSWRLARPKPAGPLRKRNRDRSLEKKGEQIRRAAQRAAIGQGTSVPLDRAEAEASHYREVYKYHKEHSERLLQSLFGSHQVLFLEPRVVFASARQFLMGLANNDEDTATGAPSRGAIGCHTRGATGAPITAASCSARLPGSGAGELHGIINSSGGAVTGSNGRPRPGSERPSVTLPPFLLICGGIAKRRNELRNSRAPTTATTAVTAVTTVPTLAPTPTPTPPHQKPNPTPPHPSPLPPPPPPPPPPPTERGDNFCFGASSVEASVVDPRQRLLLEAGLLHSFAGAHLRRAALMHSGLGVLLVGTKHPTTTPPPPPPPPTPTPLTT